MTKETEKYVFLISATIIAGGLIYLLFYKKKAPTTNTPADTTKPADTTTTPPLVTKAADSVTPEQALDPGYYKTSGNTTLLSQSVANSTAQSVHDDIHGFMASLKSTIGTDGGIVDIFVNLQNQSQVSQVAEAYKNMFNLNLIDDLKTIDYWWGIKNHSWFEQIMESIQYKPY